MDKDYTLSPNYAGLLKALQEQDRMAISTTSGIAPRRGSTYSLAEVQLMDGSMVGMTISAATSISNHLIDRMAATGFLYLFNDSESLLIRASDVRAIRITNLTKE